MFRNKIDTKSLGLDLGVDFIRFLTGKEHLHYGLWEEGLEVCARNLIVAQEAYTNRLLALLPTGAPLKILDIGGGAGETAKKLLELGHSVCIVVPSPSLAKRCKSIQHPQIEIHQTAYEEFDTQDKYDVCLFSESFQYVALDQSLSKAKSELSEGGRIIIADCFRSEEIHNHELKHRPVGSGHLISTFREEIHSQNLTIEFEDNITKLVAPSVELEQEFYSFIGNSLNRVDKDVQKAFPQIRKTILFVLSKILNEQSREKLANRLYKTERNAQEFCKFNTYLIMVLKH